MALSIPRIDLPWRRKTPLERAQAQIRRFQKEVKLRMNKLELPKVNTDDVSAAVEDTRRTAADGMEQVAGQVAVTAAKLGHQASKVGREYGERGRKLGQDLALTGEENLRHLGGDLRALTDDVRSMRVTRKKRSNDMLPGIALLAGIGAGMAAMYFFDAEHGRRRRALLRDQVVKWSRVTSERVNGQVKDLRNRSVGLAHEMRKGAEEVVEGDSHGTAADTDAVAQSSPDAAPDLATTDAAAGGRQPKRRRSTEQAAEASTDNTAGSPAATGVTADAASAEQTTAGTTRHGGARQEDIYGSFGEVASETWGDMTVPEGREGQTDLSRER